MMLSNISVIKVDTDYRVYTFSICIFSLQSFHMGNLQRLDYNSTPIVLSASNSASYLLLPLLKLLKYHYFERELKI
jgi:hypothetical protein